MADNALAILIGEVRGIKIREYTDKETGDIQERGRDVRLVTETGFVTVRIPQDRDDVQFENKKTYGVVVELREWSFNSRNGVTLVFNSFTDPAKLQTIIDKAVYGEPVKA